MDYGTYIPATQFSQPDENDIVELPTSQILEKEKPKTSTPERRLSTGLILLHTYLTLAARGSLLVVSGLALAVARNLDILLRLFKYVNNSLYLYYLT